MYSTNASHRPFRAASHLGFLLLLAVLFALTSCGEADNEYASTRCYFFFDNSKYQDITLQAALNPLSPGTFCKITERTEGGRRFVYFDNNQGQSSHQELAGDDTRRTFVLGVYNKTGIIVGFGNLSSPTTLYIYDSQCPNCYNETHTLNHPLAINDRGYATCATCKREYNMNNRGITPSGKPLMRYRGNTTGPLGVLSVSN